MTLAERSEATGSPSGDRERLRPAMLVGRIALVVLGGYVAASAAVAALAVVLARVGMARSEAVVSASMLGFVIYLGMLLWGAAERRLTRLILGYAVLTVLGIAPWALSRVGG